MEKKFGMLSLLRELNNFCGAPPRMHSLQILLFGGENAHIPQFVIVDLKLLNTNCYLVLGWLIYGVRTRLIFLLTFKLLLGLNLGFSISSFILIMFISIGSRLFH